MNKILKVFCFVGTILLSIMIIMGVTIASVLGVKTLYQALNPAPSENHAEADFKIGDTVEDVTEFTSQVEAYTKTLGR